MWDREQQDGVRNAGPKRLKVGKKRSFSEREGTFILDLQFLGRLGRGMVALSTAMQISLQKAAMVEEVKKHTEAKGSRH